MQVVSTAAKLTMSVMSSPTMPECPSYSAELCARIYGNALVQQMLYGYELTKHSCGIAERTLGGVESRVQDAAGRAYPLYEYYLQPPISVAANACTKGMEGTKYALEMSKNAAVSTSVLGIGSAVVAFQLSLALGVAGASLLLDSVIASKRVGSRLVSSAQEAEQAVEQRLIALMQAAHGAIEMPAARLTEQANSFLDVANAVVDRVLDVHSESDPPACTLGQRVSRLTARLSGVLTAHAHDDVIDPLYQHMNTVMEHFAQSIILMDMVRERKTWVVEKASEMQCSISDLKERIETEAARLELRPEDMLIRSLRHSSTQLTSSLTALKDRSNQLLSDATNERLATAVCYFTQLDDNLAKADNIYSVKDEIVNEARDRLADVASWTSSWLVRERASLESSA